MLLLLVLGRHFLRSWSDSHGTTTYYYEDEVTWLLVAAVSLVTMWFLLNRYLRSRGLRRLARPLDRKSLRRVLRIKNELSSRYLGRGFSNRIHAVGVGKDKGTGEYCIQVFMNEGNEELWVGAGNASLPGAYRGVPLVPIQMPAAVFLTSETASIAAEEKFANGIRDRCEVIVGGISGANSNLNGQSGTIGYFCTRRSRFRRARQIHLLSNSHVFADLRKGSVDEQDLIMQPSPGEPGSNRPIGALADYSVLAFDDSANPNRVDAAIARLWDRQTHEPLIPLIGSVKGYVKKNDVQPGEGARKFGRTTGYSEGNVFSIFLDIWIRYDRTGRSAFFKDQILVEPTAKFSKFVSKGDSGSLLVDDRQYAIGLIFAGMAEVPESAKEKLNDGASANQSLEKLKRVEGYGVANPISDVLDRMKIDLLVAG